ncbi:hypothetical protein PX52LOC_06938 [Limnoglobus roseus]|uniref:Uncharacterized protein n=1 Tax=Limnoglobus roseus TaxID=2598579 RepID=A0A5C1ANY0_9BACT|nr:hypothetical protein PX52LOC_06938 [Limnoglobus roseus]
MKYRDGGARGNRGKRAGVCGAVVQAFTTGIVVQVCLLDGHAPTEAWSGSEPGK